MTRQLALLAAATAIACGSRPDTARRPAAPAAAERASVAAPDRAPGAAPGREILLGEMCPTAADSRPAIIPMVVRKIGWTADPDEAGRPLRSRTARQFSVFSWDGRRAGLFSVAGAADVGLETPAATGAYAGAMPCAGPNRGGDRAEDPECLAAQRNCGVAVAVLEPSAGLGAAPYDEDPRPEEFAVGGGCVSGDRLLVDIDGDGGVEAYPVAAFVAALYEPADEVTEVTVGDNACEPVFASRSVVPAGDPRDWRGLDLLAVIDLDGDGRRELLLAYRYAGRATWGLYSSRGTVARLELVAESVPWAR